MGVYILAGFLGMVPVNTCETYLMSSNPRREPIAIGTPHDWDRDELQPIHQSRLPYAGFSSDEQDVSLPLCSPIQVILQFFWVLVLTIDLRLRIKL